MSELKPACPNCRSLSTTFLGDVGKKNWSCDDCLCTWDQSRSAAQITPQAGEAEHIPNAEFCPHCNPCRNTWGMVEAQRLNEQYDECLRDLAAYVGAGGYNSADLIDPKIANEKVRWGIDHIVRVQHAKPDRTAPPRPVAPAKTLDQWHEDFGPVVWFCWDAEQKRWLGEPAWIGTPNDDSWPEYHTHWIPHPEMPSPPDSPGATGGS